MKKLYEGLLNRVSVRTVWIVCALILVTAGIGAAEYLSITVQRSMSRWCFGGNEVVELHVAAGDTFRAISRISLTQCPWNISYLPLHLPQPGAKIESVTIGGRKIPVRTSEGRVSNNSEPERDTYIAMASMPGQALKNEMIEVVWSYPMADAALPDHCYRFNLQGLLPVRTLTLNVVIDDGMPYQFTGPFAARRDYNMFYERDWSYTDCTHGSCDITLEPSGS